MIVASLYCGIKSSVLYFRAGIFLTAGECFKVARSIKIRMKKVVSFILATILLLGAIAHIVRPEFYAPMIPEFIPMLLANILAAIAEAGAGIMLIIPKYRKWGGMSFMVLMIAFLPIHVWDFLRENPAIGAPPMPAIRLAFQFVLIYAGWWIYKSYKDHDSPSVAT